MVGVYHSLIVNHLYGKEEIGSNQFHSSSDNPQIHTISTHKRRKVIHVQTKKFLTVSLHSANFSLGIVGMVYFCHKYIDWRKTQFEYKQH